MENEKNQQVCAVTKEEVLKAIHDFKTTSAKEISEKLDISIASVYAVLANLTQADLSQALGVCPRLQEETIA
jgi:Mn-dependent DtxR family transcriptional regulator